MGHDLAFSDFGQMAENQSEQRIEKLLQYNDSDVRIMALQIMEIWTISTQVRVRTYTHTE